MDGIKILHTADLHISDSGSGGAQALARIIDLAKINDVEVIMIVGDLFDKAISSESDKSYVIALFTEIPHIKVLIGAGNHDPLQAYKDIMFPSNVYLFGRKIEKVQFKNADIYGVSFPEIYQRTSLIGDFIVDKPDKINILMMHGECVSASKYNPISARELEATGIDYAALGHVHTFSGVQRIGGTYYAYPGIPQGRGFDETGDKGVLLGEVFKGGHNLEFVKTSEFEYIETKVDVSGCNDYCDIVTRIREAELDVNNVYRIKLCGVFVGDFSINGGHVESLLSEFKQIEILDTTDIKVDLEALAGEYSLRGIFAKKALEKGLDERAIQYGLAALDGKKVEV